MSHVGLDPSAQCRTFGLIGGHIRELCGRRDLVSGGTRDGVGRATAKRTVSACLHAPGSSLLAYLLYVLWPP